MGSYTNPFYHKILKYTILKLNLSGGKLDYKTHIVGLIFCIGSGAVFLYLTAFAATVQNHVAFFGAKLNLNRIHNAKAFVCSVAGIYVNMDRAKAKRAMIA